MNHMATRARHLGVNAAAERRQGTGYAANNASSTGPDPTDAIAPSLSIDLRRAYPVTERMSPPAPSGSARQHPLHDERDDDRSGERGCGAQTGMRNQTREPPGEVPIQEPSHNGTKQHLTILVWEISRAVVIPSLGTGVPNNYRRPLPAGATPRCSPNAAKGSSHASAQRPSAASVSAPT